MKVLAVVPAMYDTSPGQRYRIEQWEPYLRDLGVDITYLPFETPELRSVLYKSGNALGKMRAVVSGLRRRRADLSRVKEFDLIYLFREAALLGPAWFERKIAATGVPIVFDFDDAVFVPYVSPSNGYLSYLKFPGKTETIIRLATRVIAGNEYLADYSRKFNRNVTIVPTTIDTNVYGESEGDPENDVPVIGWSGSHSTMQHLETIKDILQELAQKHEFRLRVIGAPNFTLPGVDTEAMAWRSETEVEDLRQIDAGIMPLPSDEWSKGKCGLKALQYMALQKPTVCSPVGVNTEIIQEGVNGMLAGSRSEWLEKLSRLILDKELRIKLGKAGRQTVVERFSAAGNAPRVFEVFASAVKLGNRETNGKT